MLSLREANHHSDSCRLQNMASDALCVYNPLEKNNVFLGSNILLVRVLYWGHKSNLLRKKRSVSTTTKKFSLGANGNQSVTKSRTPPPQSYFWNMFVSSCFLFFPMLIPIKSISGGGFLVHRMLWFNIGSKTGKKATDLRIFSWLRSLIIYGSLWSWGTLEKKL